MSQKVCKFPGCDKVLAPTSITGLCRQHNHAEGLCGCKFCQRDFVVIPKRQRRVKHAPQVWSKHVVALPQDLFRRVRDAAESRGEQVDFCIARLLEEAMKEGSA